MIDYDKGNRTLLYEMLYSQYSNLAFSFRTDRPVAIRGLERRLIRAFETKGGYGVFDKYFERGLLWQRARPEFGRIPDQTPKMPSWSWMGYQGAIEYMAIPFGQVKWNDELVSPFKQIQGSRTGQCHTGDIERAVIRATARRHFVKPATNGLVFDEPSRTLTQEFRVVVVGTLKQPLPLNLKDREKSYVLLVVPTNSRKGCETYQRIGVGTLERREIDYESPSSEVLIW
jgi:hypothetical protein